MKKIKIGFLPLYIKLYDDSTPQMRPRLEAFYKTMADKLTAEGFDVLTSPFCRVSTEFSKIISDFESKGAECIVTLHMAYSPSLESAEALSRSRLPVVVMDTTETFDFGYDVLVDEIDYNHGIHGVMDMCNLLRRNKKPYAIATGHFEKSDVVSKTAKLVKSAVAARSLKGSSVGVIGDSFYGMGDFLVSGDELRKYFGIKLVTAENKELRDILSEVTDAEIMAEKLANNEYFESGEKLDVENYIENIRACLATRKWIEKNKLSAFSVNFLKIGAENIASMPFTEACKQMANCVGYAGEGDALTASFVGAFLKVLPETSFIEIFCPDWKGDRLFISHMGEMNYAVADSKPKLFNMEFSYNKTARNTVYGAGRFKPGKAVYGNIYRDEEGFKLAVSPIEVLSVKKDKLDNQVRGWIKPEKTVPEFLKSLSEVGATHHSFMIYDGDVDMLKFFGKVLGIPVVEI